ncbi:hypothetical protein AJ80_05302 [Polytolypa hystricis UAMH7299]|uniref:U3 small nucleolar RNA-associated protein 22 n=1 Tax=Polytolypa hystricis (strain UAMH7299) TaxID=1447883 RepID=A0A2B7Y612_POLH7|nr:hypothetical protein AJ80_05302 [Polytolypa hystricis UAMH7299]
MSSHGAKRRKLSDAGEQQPNSKMHSRHPKTEHSRSQSDAPTREVALATGLYKSGFFKLQVDELLSQLRPDHDKQLSRVEATLRKLKTIIEGIPDVPPKKVSDAEKELRKRSGIVLPFPNPRPKKDTKYMLEYVKPSKVNVVGSFARKTEAKSNSVIDLAVTIPSSLFQRKDYLNYRYFHKRAYYIACIAEGIQDAKVSGLKIRFTCQDGNTLRPAILVEPAEGADDAFVRSKATIRILTCMEETVFPISQTLPTSRNIRQKVSDNETEMDSEDHEPTPLYNGVLRSEACVNAYLKLLHAVGSKCAAFGDASILGRTWLHQRGFGTSFTRGGFGHFEWSTLVALLFETGGPNGRPLLSPSYSSYQIFKATMQFIAKQDLIKPLVLFSKDPSMSAASNAPIMFDGKRGLNLLYKMTPWSYELLRREAHVTLEMLNDSLHDHFASVFITKVDDPLCRFDQVISIAPKTPFHSTLDAVKYQLSLSDALLRALGDRAKLVHFTVPDISPWHVGSAATVSGAGKLAITAGLILDPDHASRIVDQGPPAEDKADAASFREFWGDKAELRRFKDGSIVESLVWSDPTTGRSVIQQIVLHILQHHFGLGSDCISFVTDRLCLELDTDFDLMHTTAAFQPMFDAFSSLEKLLQITEGLPLTLHQLSAACPQLRYASAQLPADGNDTGAPADVVVQFEASTLWPDDLAAIQMTKLAFLLKIGELLEETGEVISCQVGVENEDSKILNSAFLDIVLPSSITFRLRIYHDREQTLLERQLKNRELGAQANEELAFALAAHRQTFIHAPRHTQAIRTLSTRFPLLSPTIRLFKKWAASHLFSLYLCEELLELLVCRVFLGPYPWHTSSSVLNGFVRTLHFLARWDWQYEPLILDFSQQLKSDDLVDIKTRFDAWRKIDPLLNTVSLFVASSLDPDGVIWTRFAKPPKVVAARLSSLAAAATKLIRERGLSLCAQDLFRSPLTDYDFLLFLNPKYAAGRKTNQQRVLFKNLQSNALTKGSLLSSQAAQAFVNELTRLYGHSILFFYGDQSKVIAGVWNPQSSRPRAWNLKIGYSTIPIPPENDGSEPEDKVTLNKTGTLNEIATLGGDLVEKIQMNR